MALQKQVIPIPFAQGIDTKSDPKQVVPGKLISLFNGVFQSAKRILKRNGFTSKSKSIFGGGSIANGVGLKSYENEIDLLDGDNFFSYSKSKDKWTNVGTLKPMTVASQEITSNIARICWQDSAYNSAGYYGYAYVLSNNTSSATDHPLRISITDASTGSVIIDQQVSANVGYGVKILSIGNYLIAIYQDVASAAIKYSAVDVTNPSVILSAVTIATDINNDVTFDACVVNNVIYLAYQSTGVDKIGFYYLTSSLFLSSRGNAATGALIADGGLSIVGDASNNIWFFYVDRASQTLYGVIFTEFLATILLANTTINTNVELASSFNVAGFVRGTVAQILYTICPASTINTKNQYIKITALTISGSAGSSVVFKRSVGLYGKPFLDNGIFYIVAAYSRLSSGSSITYPQPTLYIISETTAVVARLLSNQLDYFQPVSFISGNNVAVPLSNTNSIASRLFEMSSLRGYTIGSTTIVTNEPILLVGNALTALTINFNKTPDASTIALDLNISGGMLWTYDGNSLFENNFNTFPDYLDLTESLGTGGLSVGTYQYVAIYEWIDAKGNHYRSGISPQVQITTTAPNSSVSVVVPTLRLTQKSQVQIALYRSSANGTTLRRVTQSPLTGTSYNDPSVDSITILDGLDDVRQAGGDILYTTGGEVENIPPPATNSLTTYRSRLILFPSEQTTSFWYSKEVVPGFPAEFSDFFVQNIDEIGGAIVGGIQMDDKLIIFKANNIFYMTGQGPANNGSNNDFSTPFLINSDVGCIDRGSIVLMPNGVMFKSNKGIYLLDRSLAANYIGAEVESYNPQTVTSAQLMKDVNQVRFTLNSGVCLVYDYYFSQWSVFSNISAVDSCSFENKFTYLKSDGTVLEETPGQYNDDGAFIPLSLTTAWLSMAGIQGFQRVYKALLLGDKKGSHTLVVKVRRDFNSTVLQTDNIDATAINPSVYQWRIFPIVQKCEAIQLEISDSQSSAFNEGFDISDLTLEVGTKSGAFKMPASQSFG